MSPDAMEISALLAPVTLAEFRESWNRRSRAFLGRRDRFAGLAFDLDALLRAAAASRASVKAQFLDAEHRHNELAIEPEQIAGCFSQGMTICMRNIDALLPELAQQTLELRRSMRFPGTMNFSCYWSPESGGFGLHYDDHAVFIFQLGGKKRWWYSEVPAVSRPRGNIVYTEDGLRRLRAEGLRVQEPDRLDSVILEPGDMLYLPAGAWHRTCALDGESCALTLRCADGSSAEIVHHVLRILMDADEQWHRSLPPLGDLDAGGLGVPAAIEAAFADRLLALQQLVQELTTTHLARAWAERLSYRRSDPVRGKQLAPDDRLAVCKNVYILRSEDGDEATRFWIYDGRSECQISIADHVWFERVMHAGSFVASQACHWGLEPLPWDTAKEWLEELADGGIIELAVVPGR